MATDGETYRLGFGGDSAKQAFLDYCVGQSVIDTGVTPQVWDRIITLSTCTGRGHETRWVVQARLPGEAPAEPDLTPEEPAEDPIQEPEEPVQGLETPGEGENDILA